MISVKNSVIFNSRWKILTGSKKKTTKGDGSVFKCVNLQDSIIDDVGGHVNNEFLQYYCCIKNYDLSPSKIHKKIYFTTNIKIDIVDEVISCIKEQFKVIDSRQIAIGKKPNKLYLSLSISGSTELLHDHIVLIVRSHISYILFDDVLN